MDSPVLRDYQIATVSEARSLVARGVRRILVVAPTGSGKTVIASAIIRGVVQKSKRALFLAHRRELVDQCSAKLDQWGVDHGVIQAGHPRNRPWLPVQVASVQTLVRRAKPDADLVIVDEAHHARAGTYERILECYPRAPVLGLTATPWRLDGKGLGDLFARAIVAATPRRLVDDGHLVPCTGYVFQAPALDGVRRRGGDFVESDLEELTLGEQGRALAGDVVEQYLALSPGRRAIVFAVSVLHSRSLAARFRAAGVEAEHVDGRTPAAERAAILARLAAGRTKVVCNCNLLTEGFDCPSAEVAILARPTLSTTLFLQMIGRVLRPHPGKTVARVHDHAGCIVQLGHGLPDAERDYSLVADVSGLRKGEAAPKPATCEKCRAAFDAELDACPSCGWVHEKEKKRWGGRIREIADVEAVPLEQVDGAPRPERLALAYLESQFRVALRLGYRAGWVSWRYKARFGHWPAARVLARAEQYAREAALGPDGARQMELAIGAPAR